MSGEFWALRDDVHDDDIPVAELSEPASDGRHAPLVARAPRSRRVAALVLAGALATAGIVVVARASNDANNAQRRRVTSNPAEKAKAVDSGNARLDVFSALNTTTASGSFHIRYTLSAEAGTNPGGYDASNAPLAVSISGEGVVNVDPIALVTTSEVPNVGKVTTRVDGTNVWEDGGANYGSPTVGGAGAPLSQFATLVLGTLGRREGAVAMNSLGSPTGYLNFAKEAISAASKVGDSSVDGVAVQEYQVTIDAMRALERPGLTPEEIATTAMALKLLQSEGYATTSVRLAIDGLGFVRHAHTIVRFHDGGTVTSDTTFSDFGCSSVVMESGGPSIVANPNGCTAFVPESLTSVPGSTSTATPVATATPAATPTTASSATTPTSAIGGP
ncbi:MAG TPA: hypothetical protein VGP92_17945 [Acidimicrobiia bacterium]|nr:hypothetical protein [Acidimicrobiia bacterium]